MRESKEQNFTRRGFLRRAARVTTAAAGAPLALQVLLDAMSARAAEDGARFSREDGARFSREDGAPFPREVDFYKKLSGGRVRCGICPNLCQLEEGETGFCRSRSNVGGRHWSRGWGKPCIVSVDPIEKLPFNNFLPGEKVVSLAVGGCNLRCLYCQNWEQSQKKPDNVKPSYDLDPEKAVGSASKREIDTIAFTYTEPTAFLEYQLDIAVEAAAKGVRCVSGTSAFINPEPIKAACRVIEAFAVTLKGFDETFYRKVCGAGFKPVLESLETIKSEGRWLELSTLIVPTYNDDMAKIGKMAKWIRKNLGTKVPWHFARFVPRYKLKNLPQTPVQTLEEARNAALDAGIEFVYTSNIAPHAGNNTYCPRCKRPLIERVGFKVLKSHMQKGRCPGGHAIAGVFDKASKSTR